MNAGFHMGGVGWGGVVWGLDEIKVGGTNNDQVANPHMCVLLLVEVTYPEIDMSYNRRIELLVWLTSRSLPV